MIPIGSRQSIKNAQKIHDIAKNVLVQVGEWKGTCNLFCVPLDDVDLLLSIDFFLKAKVA